MEKIKKHEIQTIMAGRKLSTFSKSLIGMFSAGTINNLINGAFEIANKSIYLNNPNPLYEYNPFDISNTYMRYSARPQYSSIGIF